MERVKRLAGYEIELGMMIPTIESQASVAGVKQEYHRAKLSGA